MTFNNVRVSDNSCQDSKTAPEREHILKALSLTNWVIGGPGGAAARLGMKRTTLVHTMKRRGISRDLFLGAAKA